MIPLFANMTLQQLTSRLSSGVAGWGVLLNPTVTRGTNRHEIVILLKRFTRAISID
jgi:hypothetical protein